jgi:D-lactate dehydrogenase
VDRCIECGFCESNCPSKDLTLTPRQRITVWREVSRLRSYESRTPEQEQRLKELEDGYVYQGEQTCAADGMCQVKCPVGINTGELIKHIRADQLDASEKSAGYGISKRLANNFGAINASVPTFLNIVDLAHRLVGPKPLEYLSTVINKASRNYIPEWNKYMPRGASKLNMNPPVPAPTKGLKRQVVYAPACVTRMMGPARGDTETESVHEKLLSLFNKAGYEVIYPKNLSSSCCGMMFNSRGFKEAAAEKGSELEESLLEASQGGKLPIVMDTSPCLAQLKGSLSTSALRFSLYEPIEFIKTHLKDKLEWEQVRDSVAIHVPCSSKKMGITDSFTEVASLCAKEVTPSNIPCCGMAGDRGMRYPELTGSSLQHLNLPSSCTDGYSSSRTCEMSMSNHSGIHFRGLVYLVDEATKAKQASA